VAGVVLGLAAVASSSPVAAQVSTSPEQARLERAFSASVSPDSIGSYIRTMTAHPTFPGSPFSAEVARETLDRFRRWGWDAHVDTFYIPFPRPTVRRLELLGSRPFTAALREPAIPGDPYSARQDEHLETYFIYGPDGDVTAPLVYANFGLREDYAALARMGVSVRGRIVLARSGRMWRGGKVELAAEQGAAAVLVYSDPRETGYYDKVPYPEGPGRTADGVERGSVLYGKYPGDPLTPDVPSTKDARRLPIDSPKNTIARIPAMPLSAADARPLLADLGGQVVPENWRGALPVTYRTSRADVHLEVRYRWDTIQIRDVIATLRGSTWPEELIVRGNHRDGWVYGAQDPHSGHSALLEEARNLGRLYRDGWHPRRTIVYASWDAEEQGTIGSTEWVEENERRLAEGADVYLNTDVIGPGDLTVSGASAYARFATGVASDVRDPGSGVSVLDRARVASEVDLYGGSDASPAAPLSRPYDAERARLRMEPPGYGSDHHTFVSHAGVATLNFGFWGGFSLGAYHTSYDDFAWYRRFGDPGYRYGAAAARLNGIAVLRLADADVLPVDFRGTADAVAAQVAAAERLYARLRNAVKREERLRKLDAYRILADSARPRIPPAPRAVPDLDLAPLDSAVASVRAAADRFAAAREAAGSILGAEAVARINSVIRRVDRSFLRPGGFPGRPYYENELWAPGRLWDTVPLPALGDAMLDGRWDEAARQLPLAARTLESIASAIDAAASELARAGDG
jgi:N-acetylated-alpha-linked acidic dipeptidase